MKFTGERHLPQIENANALSHYHRYYFVLNQIDLEGKVVLDIACGEGYGANILSGKAKLVYGVDISSETIDHARKAYFKEKIKFLVASVASVPLEDKSVDIVVSFETIEHHNQHIQMMQEIKRVLKYDGILIISSPNKGYYEKYYPGFINEYHVKELYQEEFKNLIKQYFKHTNIFIQNNVEGSFISNESENCNYKRPFQIEKTSGVSHIIEPRFNISIASDSELSFSSSISICRLSFQSEMSSIVEEQSLLIENIYNSGAWKLARFLLYPVQLLRKIISVTINKLRKLKNKW